MSMKKIIESWDFYLTEQKCKLPNRGDIAEGIVAAAIAAKLSKRIDGKIGMVDASDVIAQIANIKQMNAVVSNVVPDFSSEYEDKVSFSISMPKRPFEALLDRNILTCLQGEYEGAVSYVNSPPMHKFATRLASNRKSNDILVKAAGTEDQKGTKVDISIIVDGNKLRNQLSLKVKGGEQFAQKTGKAFDVQKAFWEPLGIDVSSAEQAYNRIVSNIPDGKPFFSRDEIDAGGFLRLASDATSLIYQQAYKVLESKLQNDRFEAEFVKLLADYIKTGAVGPESEFIELVKILPGGFKRARFGKKFYTEMEKANLYPIINTSGSYPKIQIIYEDAAGNKSVLVQMRAKVERASGKSGGTKKYGVLMRNYLETGPALYKLAGV
tara:strand:+ start:462 stop:1604 length:1143 start_codon:yes stop_codon:yes gene_type:complete